MTDHPPYSWMMRFIRGKLNPRKRRAYVAHLLRGCKPCQKEIAPISRAMFYPGRAAEPTTGEAEYDGPINRAVLFAVERGQERLRNREEAEKNLVRLVSEDWKSVSDSPGFWTRELCEALLERSWAVRYEDAREMLRFASLAREVADRLDPKAHGQQEVFDLRAGAWGEYANACRVTDDLVQSEWAFNKALELRNQGSGSPLLRARLAELTAGLLSHQRQFQPALRALDLAYTLYVRQDYMQEAARVLISRGIYTGRGGDPESALLLLARALLFAAEHKIDEPKSSFIVLHNILLFRVEHGEFAEARRQLFEMRPLYAKYAGAIDTLKLRGIEAQISAGLGDDQRAEKGFLEVREEFNKRGQVYHAAIAGLELAAVWLRMGRLSEVEELVDEILGVLRTCHVARESIAALLVLRRALERNLASHDLIQGVVALIKLHQGDDVAQAQP